MITTSQKDAESISLVDFCVLFALIGAALLFLASNDKDQFIGHIAVYNKVRKQKGVKDTPDSTGEWGKSYVGACLYFPSSNHDFGKADKVRKVR